MNGNGRGSILPNGATKTLQVHPKRFVFFDKGTGTERFEVKAGADGMIPINQAASLMAIHCLVRGRTPKDFGVMVTPEENLLDEVVPLASRLVDACAESRLSFSLSQRQRQVLRALLQDSSNKEIAAKLNVSVRTVKFHVAALFEKFQVNSRFSLMRKAADILLPEEPENGNIDLTRRTRLLRANGPTAALRDRAQFPRILAGQQRASR